MEVITIHVLPYTLFSQTDETNGQRKKKSNRQIIIIVCLSLHLMLFWVFNSCVIAITSYIRLTITIKKIDLATEDGLTVKLLVETSSFVFIAREVLIFKFWFHEEFYEKCTEALNTLQKKSTPLASNFYSIAIIIRFILRFNSIYTIAKTNTNDNNQLTHKKQPNRLHIFWFTFTYFIAERFLHRNGCLFTKIYKIDI